MTDSEFNTRSKTMKEWRISLKAGDKVLVDLPESSAAVPKGVFKIKSIERCQDYPNCSGVRVQGCPGFIHLENFEAWNDGCFSYGFGHAITKPIVDFIIRRSKK